MPHFKPNRVLACVLVMSQLVLPLASQAATTYQLRKAVPSLVVAADSGTSTGSTSTGSTGGSTGSSGSTSTSGGSGTGGTSTTPPTAPSGTAEASWSSAGLNFGSLTQGLTSAAQTLLLTNTGSASLALNSAPSASGDFSATSDCGSSLAVNASCHVNVVFHPTAVGARSGAVSLSTNVGPAAVSLSGMGLTPTAPVASLSSVGLDFGSVTVGQTSAVQSLLLTNQGNAALTLNSVPSVTGDFAVTTDCAASVAAGASCHLNVTFHPTTEGLLSGSLSLSTNAGAVSANLAGVGFVPLAKAAWESTTLDFGGVPTGTTLTKTVKLFNDGNIPADWSSLSSLPSGVAADASSCTSVTPAHSCTVSFTYAPTTNVAYSATGVAPASGTHTNTLSITGQGLTTQAGFSTGSLVLADTDVGATSASRSVALVNLGNTTVSIGALSVTGPFAATTNCGTSLAVGASCQADVTMTPTVMGAASGSLTLGTGAGAQTVSLSGTGLQSHYDVSATSLSFDSTAVGSPVSKTSVVSNTGNKPLSLSTPTVTGTGYTLSTSCGTSLAVGASCNLTVQFAPLTSGNFSGSVTLNTSTGSVGVALSGSAVLAAQTLASFINSGYEWVYRSVSVTYPVGQAYCAGTINGTTDWAIPAKTTLGAVRTSLGASGLTAQGWPMGAGIWYWTTDVYSGGNNYVLNNTTQSYAGTADGTAESLVCARPVGVAGLSSATSGAFTPTLVGGSTSQTVTLTNSGASALTGVSLSVQGTGVSLGSTTCGATLGTGATCTATVNWTPAAVGALSNASVNVASSAANGAVSLALTGTGLTQSQLFAYGTWDTNFGSTTATLSNGNLSAYITNGVSNSTGSVRNSVDMGAGQYYWEVQVVNWGSTYGPGIGITPSSSTVANVSASAGYMYWTNYNTVTYNGTNITSFTGGFAAGDTAGFLYDGDAHTLAVSRNGTLLGVVTGIPAGNWRVAARSSGSMYSANITANFGATAFKYAAVPVGTLTADTSTDFGAVAVGSAPTRVFTYKNSGIATATGVNATVAGTGLSITANTCGTAAAPTSVASNATCSVTVQYSPTAAGTLSGASLSVAASGIATKSVTLTGSAAVRAVAQYGATRYYNDGTYATSCNAYLTGGAYTGATGSGTYRIQPAGQSASDVTCDMVTDGGGWTQVSSINTATTAGVLATVAVNDLGMTYSSVLMVADSTMYTNYSTGNGTAFKAVGINAAWHGLKFGSTWYFAKDTPSWRGYGASSVSPWAVNLSGGVGKLNTDYTIVTANTAGAACQFQTNGSTTLCAAAMKVTNLPAGALSGFNDIESLANNAADNSQTRKLTLWVR